jgi:hypothetical protein
MCAFAFGVRTGVRMTLIFSPANTAVTVAVRPASSKRERRHDQSSPRASFARYGYSKSQHRFVWGVRLVLLTDERGLPLGYTIVPPNEKEYEPLADLLTGTPAEVVIADKGLWGRAYRERLAAGGTVLLTPEKTRRADRKMSEVVEVSGPMELLT